MIKIKVKKMSKLKPAKKIKVKVANSEKKYGCFSAMDIADYIIDFYNKNDGCVSNLKLQKLLYFIQVMFITQTKTPIFPEPILAYDFGPVIENVYKKYRVFGASAICASPQPNPVLANSYNAEIINSILCIFEDYSACDLLKIIHRQMPWQNAFSKGSGTPISIEDIKTFWEVQ